MEDSKGIIRGECTKCFAFCIEYNQNCISGFPIENIEECIKKDICAVCNCSAEEHKEYRFEQIREQEAYKNVLMVYEGYTMDKALMESVKDTEKMSISRENFTYGEISALSFPKLLSLAQPKEGDVFYDLGCGAAKPVIYAALLFNFSKCVGIELLPSVFELARGFVKKYNDMLEKAEFKNTGYDLKPIVQVLEGNFLDLDFTEADIIYLPCTTFSTSLMKDISRRCEKLKPGSRIISLTKPIPCLTEESCKVIFNIYHKEEWLMTWGNEPVFYQTKE